MMLYVGSNVQPAWLNAIFGKLFLHLTQFLTYLLFFLLGISSLSELPDVSYGLQEIKTPENEAIHAFIDAVNEDKPYAPLIQVVRYVRSKLNIFFQPTNA